MVFNYSVTLENRDSLVFERLHLIFLLLIKWLQWRLNYQSRWRFYSGWSRRNSNLIKKNKTNHPSLSTWISPQLRSRRNTDAGAFEHGTWMNKWSLLCGMDTYEGVHPLWLCGDLLFVTHNHIHIHTPRCFIHAWLCVCLCVCVCVCVCVRGVALGSFNSTAPEADNDTGVRHPDPELSLHARTHRRTQRNVFPLRH